MQTAWWLAWWSAQRPGAGRVWRERVGSRCREGGNGRGRREGAGRRRLWRTCRAGRRGRGGATHRIRLGWRDGAKATVDGEVHDGQVDGGRFEGGPQVAGEEPQGVVGSREELVIGLVKGRVDRALDRADALRTQYGDLRDETECKGARTCTSRRSQIPPAFPGKRQCDSRSECPKRSLELSRVE